MERKTEKHFEELVQRIPSLGFLLPKFKQMTAEIVDLYKRDGILYIAGNGGSCCDSEHIVGELLKGFKRKRPYSQEEIRQYKDFCGERGEYIASRLQKEIGRAHV